MMSRMKSLIPHTCSTRAAIVACSSLLSHEISEELLFLLPSQQKEFQRTTYRFLDIYQIGNKASIEKERARLKDEMSRGYFADISELNKYGGKIGIANKTIVPAIAAVKFPTVEVKFSNGRSLKLPINSEGSEVEAGKIVVPMVSLVCLSFRGSSQAMIDSWSAPFLDTFRASKNVQLYEVSFIDSWILSLNPIKRLLLRIMRKSSSDGKTDALQRKIVYSFGDNYYFRKELKILNLLTGYIFLLDRFGRIRWQGFGLATEEELASLLSCTSLLLEEK